MNIGQPTIACRIEEQSYITRDNYSFMCNNSLVGKCRILQITTRAQGRSLPLNTGNCSKCKVQVASGIFHSDARFQWRRSGDWKYTA